MYVDMILIRFASNDVVWSNDDDDGIGDKGEWGDDDDDDDELIGKEERLFFLGEDDEDDDDDDDDKPFKDEV